MSVKSAVECAIAVMWLGPCQQALFVVVLDRKVWVFDYDELQLARLQRGIEVYLACTVVPGEKYGECTIV